MNIQVLTGATLWVPELYIFLPNKGLLCILQETQKIFTVNKFEGDLLSLLRVPVIESCFFHKQVAQEKKLKKNVSIKHSSYFW